MVGIKIVWLLICCGVVTGWLARQLGLTTKRDVTRLVGVLGVGWLLLLPLGGLGLTSYLLMVLPLPDAVLQVIYLHRLLLGLIGALIYFVLVASWWSMRQPVEHWVASYQWDRPQVIWWQSTGILFGQSVVLAGIMVLGIWYNNRIGAQLLVGAGTLLVANVTSWLLARYLRVDTWQRQFWLGELLVGLACLGMVVGWMKVQPSYPQHPRMQLIAHRGVDGTNGVQNTLQSLKKTSHHANWVEMDIQETKDHRFVCLHDPNLQHLGRQQILVKNRRLSQLIGMPVQEHGQHAQLTSFDAYWTAAKRRHIQLIVEIKAQAGVPSGQSAREFAHRYRHELRTGQFRVHSVDDRIIEVLNQATPRRAQLGLIRPFIISRLKTQHVAFYSLDYRVINRAYVNYLHDHHVKVYAWTVDRPAAVKRMVAVGVDGIITNDTSKVRQATKHVTNGMMYQATNFLWQLV